MIKNLKLKYPNLLLLLLIGFIGCGQPQSNTEQSPKKVSKCYTASFENDTVETKIEYIGKKISGTMRMKYKNGNVYNGILSGSAMGDTLMLKYDFKINRIDKWYRNPIALLNRNDKLIMGVGKINVVWGTGMFDSTVPINYEKGKFTFHETNCIDH